MSELELIKEWYRYNTLVRKLYLERILLLSERQRRRDMGASFPSIQDIFLHILDAYQFWFHCVAGNTGEGHPGYQSRSRKLGPKELRTAVMDTTHMVNGYLDSLEESDLRRTIDSRFTIDGEDCRRTIVVRDMIWHMAEEELQHRGELNALLWQLDIDPPVWDWDDWKKNKERKPSIKRWK